MFKGMKACFPHRQMGPEEEVVVFGEWFPRKTGNSAHKGYFCLHNVGSELNYLGSEILGTRPQAAS